MKQRATKLQARCGMSQSNRKGQRKRKQHSDFQGIHYVIGRGGKQRLRAQKLYAMKQGQTAPYISGEAPEGMYGGGHSPIQTHDQKTPSPVLQTSCQKYRT